jgi:excisionase family DNA binding protein
MSQQLENALSAKRYIESLRALSIEQFASLYGIGRTRAFEEISSGRLQTYRVGRRRYISLAAADKWQREREAEAAQAPGVDA